MLTYELAHELLEYDPDTGLLTWKRRPGNKTFNTRFAGKEAIINVDEGYKRGYIKGRPYRAHRVIWLMQTGEWPKDQIDHIDRDPANNRWDNLRDVDQFENMRNQGVPSNNISGVVGVSKCNQTGKWHARINHAGKCLSLGRYPTKDEAIAVRRSAESEYGYSAGH